MLNELLNQMFEGLMMESPLMETSALAHEQNSKGSEVQGGGTNTSSSLTSAILSSAASGLFASVLSLSCVAAYNIRWKHLIPFLLQPDKPRQLPYRKIEAEDAKPIVVVMLHGMWNNASYFEEWQDYLAEGGYTSYAVELLPGERWLPGGLLRQELVRDLEYTLQQIPHPYVLMGHSRGGIVVQGALQCSPTIRENAAGVILLGSYPLGLMPSIQFVRGQFQDGIFHNWWGALNILLFGKLANKEYTKRNFLLPTVNERAPKIARYLRESVQAPADGCVYLCWHPTPPPMPDIPALIMGAEHDVLVPPLPVKKVFLTRFPHEATHHVIIPHQAHAFRDGGWQLSMLEPLMDWLDCRNDAIVTTNGDSNAPETSKEDHHLANEEDGAWSQRVLDERTPFEEQ